MSSVSIQALQLEINKDNLNRELIFSERIQKSWKKIIIEISNYYSKRSESNIERINKLSCNFNVEFLFSFYCWTDNYEMHNLSPEIIFRWNKPTHLEIPNAVMFYKYEGDVYKVEAEIHLANPSVYFSEDNTNIRLAKGSLTYTNLFFCSKIKFKIVNVDNILQEILPNKIFLKEGYIGKRKITKISDEVYFQNPGSWEKIDIKDFINLPMKYVLFSARSSISWNIKLSIMDSSLNCEVIKLLNFNMDDLIQNRKLQESKPIKDLFDHFWVWRSSLTIPIQSSMTEEKFKLFSLPFTKIILVNSFFHKFPIWKSLTDEKDKFINWLIENKHLEVIEFQPEERLCMHPI